MNLLFLVLVVLTQFTIRVIWSTNIHLNNDSITLRIENEDSVTFANCLNQLGNSDDCIYEVELYVGEEYTFKIDVWNCDWHQWSQSQKRIANNSQFIDLAMTLNQIENTKCRHLPIIE